MKSITRKQLLKGGLAGAAVIAAAPLTGTTAFAEEGGQILIDVHCRVRPTPGQPSSLPAHVDISVQVAGVRAFPEGVPLAGAGWDTPDADATDQSGACYYAQRGSLDENVVSVHGAVLFSNTPGFVGAQVTTTADLETGDITWTFAGFVFKGKNIVIKLD